jgi:hypothetical protein
MLLLSFLSLIGLAHASPLLNALDDFQKSGFSYLPTMPDQAKNEFVTGLGILTQKIQDV